MNVRRTKDKRKRTPRRARSGSGSRCAHMCLVLLRIHVCRKYVSRTKVSYYCVCICRIYMSRTTSTCKEQKRNRKPRRTRSGKDKKKKKECKEKIEKRKRKPRRTRSASGGRCVYVSPVLLRIYVFICVS